MAVLCGFYKNVHLSTVENPEHGTDPCNERSFSVEWIQYGRVYAPVRGALEGGGSG